jgi:anthranilate/para-aminobenzoate synthase component II
MVLVIDNYDSFTYNLVQYLGELQVELQVHRNDRISVEQIRALAPERILISPGPCSPRESGLSNEIIRTFGPPSRRSVCVLGTSASVMCSAATSS